MKAVWVDPEPVVKFVAAIANLRPDFGNCRTMAVLDGKGRMVAGIVFHNWNPESEVMEVSAASIDKRWASRRVLKKAFGYLFANCQLAVARTDMENTATRRLWKAFGANEYIIPRLRGRNASEAILTLTEEDWLKSPFMR